MTRNEAIQSLKPDACPTCDGKAFRVEDSNLMRAGGIYPHDVYLVCTSCGWQSQYAAWGYEPTPPEIVYSDNIKPKPETSHGPL